MPPDCAQRFSTASATASISATLRGGRWRLAYRVISPSCAANASLTGVAEAIIIPNGFQGLDQQIPIDRDAEISGKLSDGAGRVEAITSPRAIRRRRMVGSGYAGWKRRLAREIQDPGCDSTGNAAGTN